MIGMIALGGIIVRQSILIVEFVKIEVAKGKDVKEAAIHGAEVRMRPILITTLTVMVGAFAILHDPIFSGLAISTLFGAGVATCMAVLVVPLGCISARKQFYIETADDGTIGVSPAYQRIEQVSKETAAPAGTPLWMRLYGGIISAFTWMFYIIRAIFTMLVMGFKAILGKSGHRGGAAPPPRQPSPGGTPPPPRGGTPPPPRQPPPQRPAPAVGATDAATSTAASLQPAGETAPALGTPVHLPTSEPVVAETVAGSGSAAEAVFADDVDHSGEEADENPMTSSEIADDTEGEGTVRKRRGIRLKQDLK